MDTRQKIIIGVLMLGTLMGSLDSTIVILAFPTISQSLHADLLSTLWIILIYLLVVAVCTTQLGQARGYLWPEPHVQYRVWRLHARLPLLRLLNRDRVAHPVPGSPGIRRGPDAGEQRRDRGRYRPC